MSLLNSGVRIGAAAVVVGLSLAGPQALGVAVADSAGSASVSAAGSNEPTRVIRPAVSHPGGQARHLRVPAGKSGIPAYASAVGAARVSTSVASRVGRMDGIARASVVGGARSGAALVAAAAPVVVGDVAVIPGRAQRGPAVRSAAVGAAAAQSGIVSRPVLSFLTAVLSAFGLNSPTAPANPLGALVWGWFRRVESFLGEVPAAGTPVVGTADPVTGVVTGSLNVSVPAGLPLTYTVTDLPDDGTVMVASDGTFAYVPTSFGPDTFTVTASDGVAATNQTVTVSVPSSTGLPGVVETIRVGDRPSGVAISSDGTRAYVANYGSSNVSVIDTATNAVIATIGVGEPRAIAVSPDGTRAYVLPTASQVSVIDTATNRVTATVALNGIGVEIAFSPDGTRAYVITGSRVSSALTSVTVIDTDPSSARYNSVLTTINVGENPSGIAVSPGGSEIYVTQSRSWAVSVIDAATNTITATIKVGQFPIGVAAGSRQIYVVNSYQFSNYVPPSVSVISTVSDTVIATINFTQRAGSRQQSPEKGDTWVALAPGSGGAIWVTNSFANSVAVIDCGEYISGRRPSNTVVATIGVGTTPSGIAITPDGRYAYVTNRGDGTVSVISTGTWRNDVP